LNISLCSSCPTAAEFSLGEPHSALGSRLTVQLPAGLKAGDKVKARSLLAACLLA